MIGARVGIYSGKNNTPPFAWSNTPILDRVNDYIRFNQTIALSGQFTASCWFYTDSLAATQSLFSAENNTGYIFLLAKPANTFDISIGLGIGAWNVTFAGGIPINQWNHLMLCRDSSNDFRIYLNGVRSIETQSNRASTVNYTRFGFYGSSVYPFGQNCNELAIWDGVTGTATDAAALYNSGAGAYAYDVIPSPLLYLRCNEGSGTVLTDLGSGATNADLVNVTGTYWGTH